MQRLSPDTYAARVIHGEYHPHLDGIRAFAVLPVVAFHILALLCPGGFAGVDVFFVISGYLITGGILRDLREGCFTVRAFYHRRIRRILPAYFALIAIVLMVGCALYYSRPLVHLSNTVMAATLFSANIYYSHINGAYFAPDIHDYPLLHLWSLSVEEQFYLGIPLLCAVLWRWRRALVAPVLAALAAGSLAASVWALRSGSPNAAFYLLHCRAWELLAGALLARACLKDAAGGAGAVAGRRLSATWASALASCGLLLVLAPYVWLSSQSAFPGLAALPSVAGTVLLIRFGNAGWVSRVLTWRPFVLTGKISYSLYLWHWPVIVFWKYAVYNQLIAADYVGMFLVSLALAALSWRFIELPVRASPAWTPRRTFLFEACGIVLLVGIGAACTASLGWPRVLHARANRLAKNELPSLFVQRLVDMGIRAGAIVGLQLANPFRDCFALSGALGVVGRPVEVLLVGDSHAWNLQYGLAMVLKEHNRAGYSLSHPNTFLYDVDDPAGKAVLDEVARRPAARQVILAAHWVDYAASQPQAWSRKLETFASRLAAMNRTVLITSDIPVFPYSPSDIAARMAIIPPRRVEPDWVEHAQPAAEYERTQGGINRTLAEICVRTGAKFVPLHTALRQGDRYPAFARDSNGPVPLYGDSNHLTHAGSMQAARFLAAYLKLETTPPPGGT